MENKGKKQPIKTPKEEELTERVRTFRKPLDSLGLRQERIEMVKGLVLEPEKLCYGEKKKNSIKLPGEEEPSDSSLTHDEIR